MMQKTDKLIATLAHVERLLAAMGGSPAGWTFTDVVSEGDPLKSKCACGHAIRWEYHWKHEDGRTLITGSTCVENLPGILPAVVDAMRKALEGALARAREDARKAKLAALDARVVAVREELKALHARKFGGLYEKMARGEWLPPAEYELMQRAEYYRSEISRSRRLKTPQGQLNCLSAALKLFQERYGKESA